MFSRFSIQNKFRGLILIIGVLFFAVTMLSFFLQITSMTKEISKEQAMIHTKEIMAELSRLLVTEIVLSKQVSVTNDLQDWMLDEFDEEKKKQAFGELKKYNELFRNKNFFVSCYPSQNIYFLDETTGLENFIPAGKLDERVSADRWFFEVIQQEKQYMLNVDEDRLIHAVRVWVSTKVQWEGQTIGVIGTGFHMDGFLHDILETHEELGAKTVIINQYGHIQLDTELDYIKQNSFSPEAELSQTIYRYDNSDYFRESLDKYLQDKEEKLLVLRRT